MNIHGHVICGQMKAAVELIPHSQVVVGSNPAGHWIFFTSLLFPSIRISLRHVLKQVPRRGAVLLTYLKKPSCEALG